MKKSLIVLLLLAGPQFLSLMAGDLKIEDVQRFLNDGRGSLTGEVTGLSGPEKSLLLKAHKKSPWGPFFLNYLVGFGIGSYVQKDPKGGTIGLLGDCTGVALILAGAAVSAGQPMASNYTLGLTTPSHSFGVSTPGTILIVSGAVIIAVSRIFQFIRPIAYADTYNDRLTHFLLTGGTLTFKF